MLALQHLEMLQKLLPSKISASAEDLQKHVSNLFYINAYLPDAICYAESEEDVIILVDFCAEHCIPIIPYGSGTSTEGHTAAIHGGICLNLSKMNKIVRFSPEDNYITVQPGIAYNELNKFLSKFGFHFPVEAGWGASIGGMASTNASGAGAVDSGSMAKNVAGCEVIVYKNKKACKISTGSKSLKSSTGYNLNNLFIGAEGTLGVITQVTLRIRDNFYHHSTVCCQFEEIEQVVNFVIVMKRHVKFRRVELMDKLQTEASTAYANIDFLRKDLHTILMEFSGNKRAVEEEIEIVKNYLQDKKTYNLKVFKDPDAITAIWMMRKHALPAVVKLDSSKKAINTDICVPLSKLSECIEISCKIMQDEGIKAPLVAHIGDGNFHFSVLVDPNNDEELNTFKRANKKIVEQALKFGGSCSGEHGIGLGKIPYLKIERADSLFMMQTLKQNFDPLGIFNPGKIISI